MGYLVDPTPCLAFPWWPFNPYWVTGVNDTLWRTYETPYTWPLCFIPPLYRLEMSKHPRGSPLINFGLRLPSVIIGLILNAIVLYISFFCKDITQSFKYFLGNLAICDFLFCLFNFWDISIHLLFSWLHLPMSIDMCTIQRQPHKILGYCLLYATPIISFNRYVVVVLGKADAFRSKLVVFLICLTSYFPLLVISILSVTSATTQGVTDEFCGFVLYPSYVREILSVPIGIALLALIFCNYKLYVTLHGHFSTVSTLLKKTEAEIKEEKSVLRAAILQALVPLILGLPIIIITAINYIRHYLCQLQYYRNWNWVTYEGCSSQPSTEGNFGYVTDQLFYFYPTADALLSLTVRSYRDIIKNWRKKRALERSSIHSIEKS